MKNKLILERKQIEEKITSLGEYQDEWLENTEKLFNFAKQARGWFAKGDVEQKRAIVSALGINFTLKNKQLTVDLLNLLKRYKKRS